MSLPYQIVFSLEETYKMAKQAKERIKDTVSFYVNHYYKLILAKILVGDFTAHINFKKLDEERDDKRLEEGTIVRISRDAKNHKKCLGPFSDFRNGIITSVLDHEGDTRYLIKVIGEKACALNHMPTNAYDSEKMYLRALVPRRTRIGLKGRSFQPIVDEDKLHSISYTLYSADEIEVGSFEERYQIISETMDELDSLLGITILKKARCCWINPKKYTDFMYKITWKSEEEQKKDLEKEELGEVDTSSIFPSEEEYAELYCLKQDSSIPEKADAKNEEKPKMVEKPKEEEKPKMEDKPKMVDEQKPSSTKLESYMRCFKTKLKEKSNAWDFTSAKIADLDFDNLKVLPENNDDAFADNAPNFITITT